MKTNLDHLPESKQNALQEIRRVILNEVESFTSAKQSKLSDGRVLWVILFGSYARGTYVENPVNSYYSDFDVLIVVNQADLVEEHALWFGIEDKVDRLTRSPLSLIVHTDAEILRFLQQGHYFFKDIQEQGIYLYASSKKPLPHAKYLTAEERLPIAQQHFTQWYDSACEFLIDFSHCIDRGNLKKAAFELHQATERFYSCLLLVVSNYRPNTHNIKHLHRLAIVYDEPDNQISNIFPGKDRFQRRCFNLLKRAYVDSRYSEHFDITLEELDWLYQQVQELRDCVKLRYEKHISVLSGK